MPQKHYSQYGTFHITTVTRNRDPWCIQDGIPQILIDNLAMTRNVHQAKLFAFCILPDHMHILMSSGEKGLSSFMHSFKKNSSRDLANVFGKDVCRWQKGYHDEEIRDSEQRHNALMYIQNNPIRHEFAEGIDVWRWSSVYFPHLIDPMEIWFD
ncbi:MAG: transposase [Kiritimatiellales bacterium]|nr:transposase [Kiritimatiellales bacterium]